jgi:hypothetical protein
MNDLDAYLGGSLCACYRPTVDRITTLEVSMRRSLAGALLVLAFVPSAAVAWNSFGHMTVAALAYDRLDPAVRDRVDTLLRLNPMYKTWVDGVPRADAAKLAFVMASTWPDIIKDDKSYTNDGETPNGPGASQNIGYSDTLMHRYWHYVDVPFSTDGTPLEQPRTPNALTQIEAFRAALASEDASDQVKSYDLVWLLHLVGDVHQPLHTTSRFSMDLPHGDRGGNSVKLCDKPRCRDELHALWDAILGTSKNPTSAINAAARLHTATGAPAHDTDASHWVAESSAIAKAAVYVPPVGPGAGPYKITTEYRAAARKTAKAQVTLAAARLASLLNAALGSN